MCGTSLGSTSNELSSATFTPSLDAASFRYKSQWPRLCVALNETQIQLFVVVVVVVATVVGRGGGAGVVTLKPKL